MAGVGGPRSLAEIIQALQGPKRLRPFGPLGRSEVPAIMDQPWMGPPRPPPVRPPAPEMPGRWRRAEEPGVSAETLGPLPGAETGFRPWRRVEDPLSATPPPVLPPSATPSGFIPWFNQNVNPNRVMLPIAGAAGLGALGFSAMDLNQQQLDQQAMLVPQGQSPAPIGKTPAEQELEAYMKEIMGFTPPDATLGMPELNLAPPSPMNLGRRPELLSKIQELKQYGPGTEGMLTPEDKWQFILGGLAQGAAASGGDDLGEMLFKMGAGMLAGSSKYGLTRREQEGQRAKEDRDWKRQLAQLEASAMANEYGMDLTRAKLEREEDVYKNSLGLARYNADTARFNAVKNNPADIYSKTMKAKVAALEKDPIMGSELLPLIPPEDVSAIVGDPAFQEKIGAISSSSALDEKTKQALIGGYIAEAWSIKKPGQYRDTVARYKMSRIPKALGAG